MALVLEPRIAQTTTTTGITAFALGGAVVSYGTFASCMVVSDTTEYVAYGVDASGVPTGEWEEGIGTYSGTNTLTRTTVTNSSNAGAKISFSAGTKVVIMTPSSTRLLSIDGKQSILVSGTSIKTINGISILGSGNISTGSGASYIWTDKGTVTSGTVTFTVSTGAVQRLVVGGAITIATTGWPSTGTYGELVIELVNGGAFSITWPASINWIKIDGTTSTSFTTNGVQLLSTGTDWVTLWTRDGGTTIYGKIVR